MSFTLPGVKKKADTLLKGCPLFLIIFLVNLVLRQLSSVG
jgi:hypothetical protein